MSRTLIDTRNRLFKRTDALVLLHMGHVVLMKPLEACKYHPRCLKPNRAVRRHLDIACGLLDQRQCLHRCFIVQHILQQILQLAESIPARHTFPTTLGMTYLEEGKLQIHRTHPGRACDDTLHKLFDHSLCGGRRTVICGHC